MMIHEIDFLKKLIIFSINVFYSLFSKDFRVSNIHHILRNTISLETFTDPGRNYSSDFQFHSNLTNGMIYSTSQIIFAL